MNFVWFVEHFDSKIWKNNKCINYDDFLLFNTVIYVLQKKEYKFFIKIIPKQIKINMRFFCEWQKALWAPGFKNLLQNDNIFNWSNAKWLLLHKAHIMMDQVELLKSYVAYPAKYCYIIFIWMFQQKKREKHNVLELCNIYVFTICHTNGRCVAAEIWNKCLHYYVLYDILNPSISSLWFFFAFTLPVWNIMGASQLRKSAYLFTGMYYKGIFNSSFSHDFMVE